MMYWTRGEGFATDCSAKPQDTIYGNRREGGRGTDSNVLEQN